MFLVGNQSEYKIVNISYYILLSYNSIKLSGYKMGIKFDKDPLGVEQNNDLTKIVFKSLAKNSAQKSYNLIINLTLFVWND